ncbi:class I SAM-dependent methyltransferase [Desulfosporosinus sp. BICA1-9]|uniref:class I SAM-dependent methyltransferase n=1 Tax=Desulfosporosinus sp. BICA1-9 TaxID=1531958 RepID=UPI00054B14DA|nr:class I SAM-dependent methyltransferase [Desulfosporosinus sp. BICA1-9]KJS49561.1 MAG: hypothetical protein VR66_07840 [Peptococcaceae bacterium BRH_c23]KJS81526.1 MAG: hypothetical protein JL57_26520 [Desulfosporosinus sp. BICA1-9]
MKSGLHNDYGEQWRQAMRLPNGGYSERAISDEAEKDFWKRYLAQKSVYQPDEYSVKIADEVCGLIQNVDAKSILEIGPGWGNYSLRLAAICQQYTCIDISKDVLEYVQRIASENNVQNITPLYGKWEDCTPTQCDVVFAYNCFYRMVEIEHCLGKINETADRLCIIGVNESPEQPYLSDFEQELRLPVRYTRMDCRDLEKVLHGLGICAECISISNEREYAYDTFDEMLNRAVSYIAARYDEKAVLEILQRYYHFENGKYRCRHKFRSELLYWYK